MALTLHAIQALTQKAYLVAYHAPVHFQLGFARTAHAYATALTLKVRPHPRQTRRQMLHLSQFNLQFAFLAFCAQGETIQNKPYQNHHPALTTAPKVALLATRPGLTHNPTFGSDIADPPKPPL